MKNETSESKNKSMKIVVIGGTGLIGTKLVNKLREQGHEVVAASPSRGINSVTGEGLAVALTGAHAFRRLAQPLRIPEGPRSREMIAMNHSISIASNNTNQ